MTATPSVPERFHAGARYAVPAAIASVRAALLPVVRQLGFEVEVEQFSVIEAARGSALAGLTLTPTRVPIHIRIDLDADGPVSVVTVSLMDTWKVPGTRGTALAAYQEAFTGIQGAVDVCLRRVAVGVTDSGWVGSLPTGEPRYGDSVIGRVEGQLSRQADRLLDGPDDPRRRSASGSVGIDEFEFISGDQSVRVPAGDLDGMLTAGELIVIRPGEMPPRLVADVQKVVTDLEDVLARARTGGPAARVSSMDVGAAGVPVVAFLHQQAELRHQLPLRVVMTCTTCRLERIVNPDFTRLRERSRRRRMIFSSLGLSFSSQGASPFVLAGRLAQFGGKDPDFVCQRCQGLDADETLVTFCPKCGDRRAETVLRTCPKCSFDLRTLVAAGPRWQPRQLPNAASPPPSAPPAHSSEPSTVPAPPRPASPEAVTGPAPAPRPVPEPARPQPASPEAVTEPAPAPTTPASPAAWHPDPSGRFQFRYWDGRSWTAHVSRAGRAFHDPL